MGTAVAMVHKPEGSNRLAILGQEGREAFADMQKHDEGRNKAILKLGTVLREARNDFPFDRDFGVWCKENSIRLDENDRAALIRMAGDPERLRSVLSTTHRSKLRYIYTDNRALFSHVADPSRSMTAMAIRKRKSDANKRAKILTTIEGGDKIAETFQQSHTRGILQRAIKQRPLLGTRLLEGIDKGLIKQNDYNAFQRGGKLYVKVFFPHTMDPKYGVQRGDGWFNSIDLNTNTGWNYFEKILWPTTLANLDVAINDPAKLERLCGERSRQLGKIKLDAAPEAEIIPAPVVAADRLSITMYGTEFWPAKPRGLVYNLEELRAACWLFDDLLHLVEQSTAYRSPVDRAIAVRFSVRAIRRFASTAIIQTFNHLTHLYEKHPMGICTMPTRPKNQDEY